MSIEKLIADQTAAIQANTDAVRELIVAWTVLTHRAAGMAENATPVTHAGGTPLADAKKPRKTPAAETTEAPEEAAPNVPDAAEPDTAQNAASTIVGTTGSDVQYGTVRELVLVLCSHRLKAEVVAVIKSHGYDKLAEVLSNPEDYASVTDQTKLNAIYADLQALEV